MRENLYSLYKPAADEIYPAWRFGVYFRDYRLSSGGLKVSPGSHLVSRAKMMSEPPPGNKNFYLIEGIGELEAPVLPYPIYNIPSAPGDLVIFNLCIFHSAGALLLKQHHQAQLLPAQEASLLENMPDIFEPYAEGPRNALFFDYGAPAVPLDFYIKWRCDTMLIDKQSTEEIEQGVFATDLGPYYYDQPHQRRLASDHGITLRFDRIVAQFLIKARVGLLTDNDKKRLEFILKTNKEFSPDHSLVPDAARLLG
jgi:hypothetical protein